MTIDPSIPDEVSAPGELMVLCGEFAQGRLAEVLALFDLEVRWVGSGEEIPGSYWGPPEAGLIRNVVFVRPDTPLHSALHEAGHAICMGPLRRSELHTDAGGEDLEESAVCYLQILLSEAFPGVGRERLMRDMDRWGYSFRLGSTRKWFEGDAEEARAWLDGSRLLEKLQGAGWLQGDT